LGGNFVGTHLPGSFAVGGFDEDSDVDFLIVAAH
jgi:predicted nucleotidyltransferase